ncbi:hypothetical protein [Micrococcus sp.]|uniref:hypothetical protein n=1 Tax=Micrococcus sp. TaxID=1271 RepID=UPI0026DAF44A|nr:hypothetical protein [Micrococcus sp.]MDO4239963.1 hypothetical protein [Micrococcus sp.]
MADVREHSTRAEGTAVVLGVPVFAAPGRVDGPPLGPAPLPVGGDAAPEGRP